MKQKAVWICMFLSLCTICVQGQELVDYKQETSVVNHNEHIVNWGLKGGFTSSLFLIHHFVVNGMPVTEVQNNYKIGYFGSVFMRINFARHFLQPELSYHINRCDIAFNKPLPDDAPIGSLPDQASISTEIHSIDIPVIYGYNIIKDGAYSLAVFGGPEVRYILPRQSKALFVNFDQQNISEDFRRLNLCATLGVAVTISRIFFDFRYDIGLHNISKQITYTLPETDNNQENGVGEGISFQRRDNVLSFSFGVFF